MTLLRRIASLPGADVLIEEGGRAATVADVLAVGRYGASIGVVDRVALCVGSAITGLEALALLDGRASAVLLLSPALEFEAALRLAERAGCTAFLSDAQELVGERKEHGLRVVRRVDDLIASEGQSSETQTRWLMTTSGTTGEPKIVSHSLDSLSRTARVSPYRGGRPVWAMVYDFTRFAGMQVLLQSVLSGSCLVVPPSETSVAERLRTFAAAGCTHYSATPTMWRKFLMTSEFASLRPRQVTLGGEVADQHVLSALRQTFPEARIAHIFASTEAGVGFSVTDGRAGFPVSFLTNPPNGVEMKVDGDRLKLRNPLVGRGYVGGEDFAAEDGWVETGDLVEMKGDRILFLGRATGVINVGGDKVVPEKVEQVLLEHPAVDAARVFGKKSPIMGTLVAAEVTLRRPVDDARALVQALRDHCGERLQPFEVPALLRVVDSITVSASGKMARTPI